jgi:hypothetical protein
VWLADLPIIEYGNEDGLDKEEWYGTMDSDSVGFVGFCV